MAPISTPTRTYLVPNLSLNLLSVSQLVECGFILTFSQKGCHMQDQKKGQLIGTERKVDCLFELNYLDVSNLCFVQPLVVVVSSSIWHSRLGHTSLSHVQALASSGYLGDIKFKSFDCMSCQLGKQKVLPFSRSDYLSSAPFEFCSF